MFEALNGATLGGMDEEDEMTQRRQYLHRTARLVGYKIRRAYARELRKNQTPAELHLWKQLQKQKTGGHGWRRQHIIDRFIVDFVHLGSRLVVELDGGYHLSKEQRVLDQDRDEVLETLGWTVVRYRNEEVLDNSEKIAKELEAMVTP